MKRKFPKTYTLKLTVTFNKGCRGSIALREVRDNIHGVFYCTELDDGDPETFRVGRIALLPRKRR